MSARQKPMPSIDFTNNNWTSVLHGAAAAPRSRLRFFDDLRGNEHIKARRQCKIMAFGSKLPFTFYDRQFLFAGRLHTHYAR